MLVIPDLLILDMEILEWEDINMTPFLNFCKKITTSEPIDMASLVDLELRIPDRYREPTKALISIMKPKMSRIDKIYVNFIQPLFEDMDEVIEKLESIGGDIPDSIILYLNNQLTGTNDNLTDDEFMSIIKVLACYICIQN